MKLALLSIALSSLLPLSAYSTGLDHLIESTGINKMEPCNYPESVAVYVYKVNVLIFKQFQFYLDPTRQQNHVLVLPHPTLGFVLITNSDYDGDSTVTFSDYNFPNVTNYL